MTVFAVVLLLSVPVGPSALEANQKGVSPTQTEQKRNDERDRLTDQTNRLIEAGKIAEAIPLVRKMLALEQQLFGDDHPDTVESLGLLAQLLARQEQWDEAIDTRRKAVAILESALGENHYRSIDAQWELRVLRLRASDPKSAKLWDEIQENADASRALYGQGKFQETLDVIQKDIRLREQLYGKIHPSTAIGYHNLGSLLIRTGNFTPSLPYLKKAWEIRKEVLGMEHPQTLDSQSNYGYSLVSLGRYPEALPHYKQSVQVVQRLFGKESEAHLSSLNNLAYLLQKMGDYPEAKVYFDRVLNIAQSLYGENHATTAGTLNNLAGVLMELDDYATARVSLEKALEVQLKMTPPDLVALSATMNSLGALHKDLGDFARSISYFEQSLETARRVFGNDHPHTAGILNNLGLVASNLGDQEGAKSYYTQAIDVFRARFGEVHPTTATGWLNLGGVAESIGDYEKARDYVLKALAIQVQVLGVDHPDLTATHNGLAAILMRMGDFKKAEEHYRQAMMIGNKRFTKNDPRHASPLSGLSSWYRYQGQYEEADTYGRRALKIYEEQLGHAHPSSVGMMAELSILDELRGDLVSARKRRQQALDMQTTSVQGLLGALSEAEALAHVPTVLFRRDLLLSLLRQLPDVKPSDAYRWVWRTRGLATQAIAGRREFVLGDEDAQKTWKQLRAVRKQLAEVTFSQPQAGKAQQRQESLAALTDEKERLERLLGRLNEPFREKLLAERADFEQLLEVLPVGTALVDIVETTVSVPSEEEVGDLAHEEHYDAFVIANSGQRSPAIAWIHLGQAAAIDRAIVQWRRRISRPQGRGVGLVPKNRATPTLAEPDREFDRLVWQKIEPALKSCKTIVLVPDGLMTGVPWSALPANTKSGLLLERYAITTASNPHQLLRLLKRRSSRADSLLLVGGVDYGKPKAGNGRTQWAYLSGTLGEADRIAALWTGKVRRFSGTEASESNLREQISASSYVHLATHGFFAGSESRSAIQRSPVASTTLTGRFSVAGRNPLLLSSVVLAGANLVQKKDALGLPVGDDGVLTAEEVIGIDLQRTDLVVLSACETGLGEVAGGEGVFGLQRAFALAGARSSLASLWKVDDDATMALMEEFYRNLWGKKMGKSEALRRAQLTMIHNYDPKTHRLRGEVIDFADPPVVKDKNRRLPAYYWAAFVLAGDWR